MTELRSVSRSRLQKAIDWISNKLCNSALFHNLFPFYNCIVVLHVFLFCVCEFSGCCYFYRCCVWRHRQKCYNDILFCWFCCFEIFLFLHKVTSFKKKANVKQLLCCVINTFPTINLLKINRKKHRVHIVTTIVSLVSSHIFSKHRRM